VIPWGWAVAALFLGAALGVFALALCVAAKEV